MSTLCVRAVGILVVVGMLLSPTGALAAPPVPSETTHVVQWGDALSLMASRYGVTVEAIMAANGLADPDSIYVGQRLVIPVPGGSSQGGRHEVAAGETLTSIAFRYGTTVTALAAANGLSDTDFIYVGQVLKVPSGTSVGSVPASGTCGTSYTVQLGDTLSSIARRYATTTNTLLQANDLYSDFIYEGQRLCVPPGGEAREPSKPPAPAYDYYTVRPDDTLMTIAWRFGVSQEAIMQANNLPNPSFIHVGQRLLIPDVAAPPVLRYEIARIAFARWDGGKHDLYIANTDGSHEELLLERAAGPSWSPGARSLSFFGEEGVDHQMQNGVSVDFEGISNGIVVASLPHRPGDLNQLKLVQIKQEGSARATAWSPNGKAIAWDARPGGGYRIYFEGEDGTDFEAQSAVEIVGEHPDWSPDSSKIVYRSGRDGKQGLWISDRFDSVAVRITEDGSDAFPSWSPDGRWIAFQREADDNVDIYIMPAPGATPGPEASPRPVGPDGPPQGPQGGPPHPPQGDGRPGGSYARRLTHARGPDTLPAWTPDGHIVFRSARAGSWGIYIMNVDGMGQQQIIPHADPGPDWTLGRMDLHPIR